MPEVPETGIDEEDARKRGEVGSGPAPTVRAEEWMLKRVQHVEFAK